MKEVTCYRFAKKLCAKDVIEMRRLREKGYTITHIAKMFGVGIANASRAICGENWAHVPGALPKTYERAAVDKGM